MQITMVTATAGTFEGVLVGISRVAFLFVADSLLGDAGTIFLKLLCRRCFCWRMRQWPAFLAFRLEEMLTLSLPCFGMLGGLLLNVFVRVRVGDFITRSSLQECGACPVLCWQRCRWIAG